MVFQRQSERVRRSLAIFNPIKNLNMDVVAAVEFERWCEEIQLSTVTRHEKHLQLFNYKKLVVYMD